MSQVQLNKHTHTKRKTQTVPNKARKVDAKYNADRKSSQPKPQKLISVHYTM